MDADYTKRRRESEKSRREKRWSMNSQRLEEIVAELMRPIIDVRRSFDTDLSALLEEYLTEAGLHALEASEEGGGGGGAAAAPNFTEAALLLQQSASNYGRKVDYLYQHVLNVSDSLHNSMQEAAGGAGGAEGAEAQASPRRKRARAGAEAGEGSFGPIELEASAGARREAGRARPPPTLPRMYIELEPRALAAADAPLLDYAAEPVGLLADFHVTWRLQDGLLVDELEGGCGSCTTMRALPLDELQAAIAAAAPPSPPPNDLQGAAPPSPPSDELQAAPGAGAPPSPSCPVGAAEPTACSTPLPLPQPQPLKKERKRRSDVHLENLQGDVTLLISPELQERLKRNDEFRIPEKWINRVVRNRKIRILNIRQQLREMDMKLPYTDICTFDISKTGGFPGWAAAEAAAAAAGLAAAKRARRADESDDDGFFDQSSLGDSDDSANHLHTTPHATATATSVTALDSATSAEWVAWRDGVVARAAAAEARGFGDVRGAARTLLAAVRARSAPAAPCTAPAAPAAPPFPAVLADVVRDPADVSRMFLATLFLANAGNIEIIQGPPLTLSSFSLRWLSDDERRCGALAS